MKVTPDSVNAFAAANSEWAQPSSASKILPAITTCVPLAFREQCISVSSWYGTFATLRQWLAEGWIAIGTTTALYGDGGMGKSLLAQQLMTCTAAGINFLEMPTRQVPTLGVFCEDDYDELQRRQEAINAHYGIEHAALPDMHLWSRVGMDNALVEYDGKKPKPTVFFNALRELGLKLKVKLIVIDTAADTFCGNENDRQDVRNYIQLLNKLAHDIGGAVLLCAHPSVSGIANGTGTGGSTAWNNSVRSRLYLKRPTAKNGEELRDADAKNLRELSKMKSNYSSTGEKLILRWTDGVFTVEQGVATDIVSQLARKKRNGEDEEFFLSLLDQITAQGRTVSSSKNAGTYAPREMARMNKEMSIGIPRFTEAMQRLFNANVIDVGYTGIKGADRRKKEGIRRRPDDCGEVQHG
jgi:RecA-family ATPase